MFRKAALHVPTSIAKLDGMLPAALEVVVTCVRPTLETLENLMMTFTGISVPVMGLKKVVGTPTGTLVPASVGCAWNAFRARVPEQVVKVGVMEQLLDPSEV